MKQEIFDKDGKLLNINDVILNYGMIDFDDISRIEVVDKDGRNFVNWHNDNKTSICIQDEGKTLKIFIKR